jgi:hypothetical protein
MTMNMRALIAALTISLILFSVTASVAEVEGQGPAWYELGFNVPPSITVESPNSTVAYKNLMPLNLSLDYYSLRNTIYSIDFSGLIYIIDNQTSSNLQSQNITIDVSKLSEGQHQINIIAKFFWWSADNVGDYFYPFEPIGFTVYNKPPTIKLMGYETNYNTTSFPLNFTIDRPTSWMGYSLDNKENATLLGNYTLKGLTDGSHSIVVFANDTVGNIGKSNTVFFTVNTQPSPASSLSPLSSVPEFPAWIILPALLAIATLVVVAFKKKNF